jgi:hypothetical protein
MVRGLRKIDNFFQEFKTTWPTCEKFHLALFDNYNQWTIGARCMTFCMEIINILRDYE